MSPIQVNRGDLSPKLRAALNRASSINLDDDENQFAGSPSPREDADNLLLYDGVHEKFHGYASASQDPTQRRSQSLKRTYGSLSNFLASPVKLNIKIVWN